MVPTDTITNLATYMAWLQGNPLPSGMVSVFRGHPDAAFDLKPSAFRNDLREEREHLLLRELIAVHPSEFAGDASALEELVRMQHYTLPTRLLDVTWNPLVALWFASEPFEKQVETGAMTKSGRPARKTVKVGGEVVRITLDEDLVRYFDSDRVLNQLAPLLPATHSPIQATSGNGNQKAYLAEVDKAVVDVVLAAAHLPAVDLIAAPMRTAADFATTLDDMVERNIQNDLSLDQTMREQLVRARRGQGLFRKRVLDVEPVCRITGIATPNLLIASHIKPWRACGTAAERLDGANGLMMAPHADFLFDRGLLGFEEDGRPMFSSKLTDVDADKLGMHVVQRPSPKPLSDGSQAYLTHHRANVFIP